MKRDSGTYVFELTIKSRFINCRTNLAHMHDFQPGSMLHAMFSERFDTKPAEDGCYFIDRDGTRFRCILNYLRTGQLVVPEDKAVRMELLPEAEFYRVEGMLVELTPPPFRESTLLSSDQRQILTRWLRDKYSLSNILECSLLYRASRNGWAASNFHSCCDNKGPTVTVVRSSNGYTEQPWQCKFFTIVVVTHLVFRCRIYGELHLKILRPIKSTPTSEIELCKRTKTFMEKYFVHQFSRSKNCTLRD